MWIESLQLECEELANTSEDLKPGPLLVWGSSQKHFWSVVSSGNSGYHIKWPSHGRRHISCPCKVCFLSRVFLFKLLISNVHQNGHFHYMTNNGKCDSFMYPVALLIWAHRQTFLDSGVQTPRVSGSCKMTTYSWKLTAGSSIFLKKIITSTASL